MLQRWALVLAAAAVVGSCEETRIIVPGESALFVIAVENEQFQVRVDNAAEIAQGRQLITSGASINVNGRILRGHGGFNGGYGWHLDPATVEFVDATIELCDGMPSYVQQHIDYYVDTVRYYCPWGARVVGELE